MGAHLADRLKTAGRRGDAAAVDLTPIVGSTLRRLRVRRGLSLDRLAKASGVSRAMLSQIELGQSTPTVNIVWKIASALGLPFSSLISNKDQMGVSVLRQQAAKVLTSHGGAFSSRALFPFDQPRRVEFYELRLAIRGAEIAEPHPPGTLENLVVADGCVALSVGDDEFLLQAGDAVLFEGDVPHAYRNPGDVESVMYLVVTHADGIR